MRVTIRLYKRHDLDLLALYYMQGFDFKKEFKRAILCYIHNTPVKNKIPESDNACVYSLPSKIGFHIQINPDDKEDAEILAFIRGITRGRRNSVLKHIFRNTFPPIIAPYLSMSETHEYKMGGKQK